MINRIGRAVGFTLSHAGMLLGGLYQIFLVGWIAGREMAAKGLRAEAAKQGVYRE